MSQKHDYRGRFAPSPTGPLHFGSIVSAVASYLDARHARGEWLVRIEDIDPPREIAGSDQEILRTLEAFGFEWDGSVVWQSQRYDHYQDAIDLLAANHDTFYCHCTRKSIMDAGLRGSSGMLYPGECREKQLADVKGHALRMRVDDNAICFTDRVSGEYCQTLSRDVGDFILRRSDQLWAYQLAVVVDDALQNISHIVRGSDLLDCTPRQIFLQQRLGLTTPEYLHHVVIRDKTNTKLSKQTGAAPVQTDSPANVIFDCLTVLQQQPPADLIHSSLSEIWQWSIKHWNIALLDSQISTTINHS